MLMFSFAFIGLAAQSQPLEDKSTELLPLAATNGRSMDAEFADLDSDGDLDLVLATEFGQNVVMFWEKNRFVLKPDAIAQGKRYDTEDIAIADLDNDGDLDLFLVAEDDQTNELYINNGDGTFVDASDTIPVTGVSNSVLALDVDADGDQDILIGNRGTNFLLINDGNARFTDESDSRFPKQSDTTQDIEAGDINGDGFVDLVVANEQANRILINDGKGNFADETEDRIGIRSTEETREADLGDIDNDGDLDLIFANVAWSGADPVDKLLVNDGSGHFAVSDTFTADSVFSVDADFADIDSDGDLDIITANISPGVAVPIRVYLNNGKGDFSNETESFMSTKGLVHSIDIECVDITGGQNPEIYITNVSTDMLLVDSAE
jgi:hypothetical protein